LLKSAGRGRVMGGAGRLLSRCLGMVDGDSQVRSNLVSGS